MGLGFRCVVLAPRVEREALHLRALLGQPAHEGEEARFGDVELLVAAIPHVRAQLELAEELLVRGEQAPRLAHARRAVEPLLEPGVPQDLDQQLDIQAVEESCALRNANAPHR